MNENRAKLYKAIAGVLKQSVDSIGSSGNQDNLPGWDSLAMINLVSELELVFGTQFTLMEVADFKSVSLVEAILEEKGVSFEG